MGVKKDCCNYDKKSGGCAALTETYCQKEGCRFYKNAEVARRQRERCEERLEKIEKGELFPLSPEGIAQLRSQEEAAERRREQARENGVCFECGKPNDRPGKAWCSECAQKDKARKIKKKLAK